MEEIELIATASFGLEAIVSRELKQLGYERQTVEDGRVTFTADLKAIADQSLERAADRARQAGLVRGTRLRRTLRPHNALPWSEWLPRRRFSRAGKSVLRSCTAFPIASRL
jgi:putative N6-adenine-specific DNA methylase